MADCKVHILNLGDIDQVHAEVTTARPDWIFHLAAFGAYSSQTSLHQMVETNVIGTANLLDACVDVGFEVFLNTGSSSEYGIKNYAPNEDELLEPNSTYAISKAAGTHYCHYVARTRNLPLATLRLYSVFGPYEEPTRLIPTVIVEGLQGKLPPLVNPNVARDYIYIDDVINAYLLAAKNPMVITGQIYNIGSGSQTTLEQVVEHARQIMPNLKEPVWGSMKDRKWDTSIWVADRSKITLHLRWEPTFSFADGFQQTIDWFQSSPEILDYYMHHREVPR